MRWRNKKSNPYRPYEQITQHYINIQEAKHIIECIAGCVIILLITVLLWLVLEVWK